MTDLGHFADYAIVPAGADSMTTHTYGDGWRILSSIDPEGENVRLLLGRLRSDYRNYKISYARHGPGHDWEFVHRDYDGAPNEPFGPPADNRCGTARTWDACFAEIDIIEDDIDEALASRALEQQP